MELTVDLQYANGGVYVFLNPRVFVGIQPLVRQSDQIGVWLWGVAKTRNNFTKELADEIRLHEPPTQHLHSIFIILTPVNSQLNDLKRYKESRISMITYALSILATFLGSVVFEFTALLSKQSGDHTSKDFQTALWILKALCLESLWNMADRDLDSR